MIEWDGDSGLLEAPHLAGLLQHTFDDGYYSPILQYVGKDKNNNDVYIDFIIERTSREGDKEKGVIIFDELHLRFAIKFKDGSTWGLTQDELNKRIEVIGNIYKNPELLEGQA
jgi:hypothetical protein